MFMVVIPPTFPRTIRPAGFQLDGQMKLPVVSHYIQQLNRLPRQFGNRTRDMSNIVAVLTEALLNLLKLDFLDLSKQIVIVTQLCKLIYINQYNKHVDSRINI